MTPSSSAPFLPAGRVEVDYHFPAGVDARKQATVIAVGQTIGSWDGSWKERAGEAGGFLAEVLRVEDRGPEGSVATVSFPTANVEGDVASLLTMIFGKFSMAGVGRVTDVRLPADYGTQPRFGLQGLRALTGAFSGPLLMAIFKPSLGLRPADFGSIFEECARAGIHIIKDDEIQPDGPPASTLQRLEAVRAAGDRASVATGFRTLFATNLTGRADLLLAKAERLVNAGANAFLLNVLTYGWSVAEALATALPKGVPLFFHPAFAGALCASPHHGLAYRVVLGTLAARCGADAVLYPAHYGSLPFDPAEELAIRDALRARGVAPVPSAGIIPGLVPRILADYGDDVILNAGTGIMDHPDGPGAGVRAFQQAIAHARPGVPFGSRDSLPGELRRALEKWGPKA